MPQAVTQYLRYQILGVDTIVAVSAAAEELGRCHDKAPVGSV
jgi:hypothetical protein